MPQNGSGPLRHQFHYDTIRYATAFITPPHSVPHQIFGLYVSEGYRYHTIRYDTNPRAPDIRHRIYYFHLTQAVYRQICSLGYKQLYETSAEFKMEVKQLCALAFVPLDDVEADYFVLFDQISNEAKAVAWYFREYYIDGRRRQGRPRPTPLFPPALWNQRDRVLADLPRTTNHLEGYHRKLSVLIQKHTGIYTFLREFMKERRAVVDQIERRVAGFPPKPTKKETTARNRRVKTIVQSYGNRPLVEYLRGIAYNF